MSNRREFQRFNLWLLGAFLRQMGEVYLMNVIMLTPYDQSLSLFLKEHVGEAGFISVGGEAFLKLPNQEYAARIRGKPIQKLPLEPEVYGLSSSCLLQYFSYNVLQR
ncbi:hypothetical protein Tco_0251740 [Tanacetum coccineum]